MTETAEHLSAVAGQFGFGTAVPSGEAGWVRLGAVVDSGLIDTLAARLVAIEGRRDVAGSYLGARLAGPLVVRTVAALVLDQRCPDPDPDRVFVRLRPDGRLDGIVFSGVTVAVLGDDRCAGGPGAVAVDSPSALRAWWATRLVAAVDPLLCAVRRRFPFGRRGLWGSLAARIGTTAAAVDRERGGCGAAGWDEAALLLDAFSAHAPVPITRPTPLSVPWSGGVTWFSTKGTCCLKYHTKPAADAATGTGYCSTCPLVDETCRVAKLRTKLNRAADGDGD